MIYDAEKIVADYLRSDTGARVVASPPDDKARAWVQLTEINAPQAANSPVDHLVAHYMQLDCYAGVEGGVPEANALAGAIRESLVELRNNGDHGVVITGAHIEGSHRDRDLSFKKARDRRVLTVTVWIHP